MRRARRRPDGSAGRRRSGQCRPAGAPAAPAQLADPILDNPNEAYRAEVIQALIDADARPQQPARHRPERVADGRRAAQRRPPAAGAGRQRGADRRHSAAAAPTSRPSAPGRCRVKKSSSAWTGGVPSVLEYAHAADARMRVRLACSRVCSSRLGRVRARRRSQERPGDSGRRDRLVRRRHRRRQEQARAGDLVQAEERLRPEAQRPPGQRRSSAASTIRPSGAAASSPSPARRAWRPAPSPRRSSSNRTSATPGSDQTRQEMLQNSHFVDAKVELFAKYGSTSGRRLAEFPVTPHADRQLAAWPPRHAPSSTAGSARSTRPPSSSRTSSASAFSRRRASSRRCCRAASRFWACGRSAARSRLPARWRTRSSRRGSPQAGGEYVYLREAFGGLAAFLTGWTSFVAGFCGAIAAGGVAVAAYLDRFVPGAADPRRWRRGTWARSSSACRSRALVAIAVILALAIVQMRGVGPGRVVQNLLTMLKIAALVGGRGDRLSRGGPEPAAIRCRRQRRCA